MSFRSTLLKRKSSEFGRIEGKGVESRDRTHTFLTVFYKRNQTTQLRVDQVQYLGIQWEWPLVVLLCYRIAHSTLKSSIFNLLPISKSFLSSHFPFRLWFSLSKNCFGFELISPRKRSRINFDNCWSRNESQNTLRY